MRLLETRRFNVWPTWLAWYALRVVGILGLGIDDTVSIRNLQIQIEEETHDIFELNKMTPLDFYLRYYIQIHARESIDCPSANGTRDREWAVTDKYSWIRREVKSGAVKQSQQQVRRMLCTRLSLNLLTLVDARHD